MKLVKLLIVNIFLITLITGCEGLTGNTTAVIDLTAVSTATGEDEVIKGKMEQATVDLNMQLSEAAGALEKQLAEKKEAFGASPTQQQTQELQQFALNATQQIKQNQAMAQQQAQQFQRNLISSWRQQIEPVVEAVARKHRAKVVLVTGSTLVWFDKSLDITDEVIAELSANRVKQPEPETGAATSDAGTEAPVSKPE